MGEEGDNANYREQERIDLIQQFKGKLLLVHGDMDANVHIAHTLQLLDQFINKNKDVDLLILPNRRHKCTDNPYFIRRVWDYFFEHLLQEKPPENYCIDVSGANV